MPRALLPFTIPRRADPRPATALHRRAGHRPALVRRPGALPPRPADLSENRAAPPAAPGRRPTPACVRNLHGRGCLPPPADLSETRAAPPAAPGRRPPLAFVRSLHAPDFPAPPADLSESGTPSREPQHQARHGLPRPFVRTPPSRSTPVAPGGLSVSRPRPPRQGRRPAPPLRPKPARSPGQPPPRQILRNRPPRPTRRICPKPAVPGFPVVRPRAAPFRPRRAWG